MPADAAVPYLSLIHISKDALPHWELAKKYDLIDFDLGVKITGDGFPVYLSLIHI